MFAGGPNQSKLHHNIFYTKSLYFLGNIKFCCFMEEFQLQKNPGGSLQQSGLGTLTINKFWAGVEQLLSKV
jgi:hypothetical protein